MMPVSVDRYLAPNLMKKTKQSNFITVREAQDNEVKILQNRFCKFQAPTGKKRVSNIRHFGVWYHWVFYETERYFLELAKQAKIKTTSCFTVQNNQLSK